MATCKLTAWPCTDHFMVLLLHLLEACFTQLCDFGCARLLHVHVLLLQVCSTWLFGLLNVWLHAAPPFLMPGSVRG